jgi:nitrile hydratase accessory protein
LNGPEAAPPSSGTVIPRTADGQVFPAPWAARAFALKTALEERGLFSGAEWAAALGSAVAEETAPNSADAEAYWRAWLTALESVLAAKGHSDASALRELAEAWRRAAELTPHGEPIEFIRRRR